MAVSGDVPPGEVPDGCNTTPAVRSRSVALVAHRGFATRAKNCGLTPVRHATGEATPENLSVAWNSFAYTASYYDTISKTTETLLTTEPPKSVW